MRDEDKTWWLFSGPDVASSYFFKRKSVSHLNHEPSFGYRCYRQRLLRINSFYLEIIINWSSLMKYIYIVGWMQEGRKCIFVILQKTQFCAQIFVYFIVEYLFFHQNIVETYTMAILLSISLKKQYATLITTFLYYLTKCMSIFMPYLKSIDAINIFTLLFTSSSQ